jgi:hypothetical protein
MRKTKVPDRGKVGIGLSYKSAREPPEMRSLGTQELYGAEGQEGELRSKMFQWTPD